MKTRSLLFLAANLSLCWGSAALSAKELPEDRLMLDIQFGEKPVENVKGLPVEWQEESEDYYVKFDASKATLPQRTLVLVYQVVEKDSIRGKRLVWLSDDELHGGGVSYFELLDDNRIIIRGTSTADGEHARNLKIDLNMENGQEYVFIQTSDSQTGENHLIVGTDDYCFYSPKKEYSSENTPFKSIRIASGKWLQVKRAAVYGRVLTQDEIEAIAGGSVDRHDAEEMDADQTSIHGFFFVHIILIGLVVWFYVKQKKERFAPVTAHYVESIGGGSRLSKEEARAQALKYLEEAHRPWSWAETADGGLTCSYPQNGAGLKRSREALLKAMQTGCTDTDIIYEYNEMAALHNQASKFVFNGWFPFVLIAFVAIIAMPLFSGEFWRMVLSWKYLGYWIALAAYAVVSMCPAYIAWRGREVEQPRQLADSMANLAGNVAAGAVMAGEAAFAGLKVGMNFLSWCLANSVSHFKVYRNGSYVGRTTELNPVGLVTFFFGIAVVIALFVVAWTFVMILLYFAAVYKFVRNYIIKR